jgi:hypothetical protein
MAQLWRECDEWSESFASRRAILAILFAKCKESRLKIAALISKRKNMPAPRMYCRAGLS